MVFDMRPIDLFSQTMNLSLSLNSNLTGIYLSTVTLTLTSEPLTPEISTVIYYFSPVSLLSSY